MDVNSAIETGVAMGDSPNGGKTFLGNGSDNIRERTVDPARIGADLLICRRMNKESLAYAICLDDHPATAATCLKAMLSFVTDCLCHGKSDEDFEISSEGATGLFTILTMVKSGLEEIEKGFSVKGVAVPTH